MTRRLKLGQLLISKGLLAPEQLAAALAEQERWGSRLGMTLVRMGTIDEDVLVKILSRQLQLPVARIGGKRVKAEILERVPAELAEKYRCMPLFTREEGGREVLFVGMDDPSDLAAIDELSFRIEQEVRPVLVAPTELEDALQRNYHGRARAGAAGAPSVPAPPPEPDTAPEPASAMDGDTEPEAEIPSILPPVGQATAEPDTDRLEISDSETDPQLPPMDTTLSGLDEPPDFGDVDGDPVLGGFGDDPVLGGSGLEDPAGMSFSAASEAPLADLARAPFGDSDPEIGDFTSAPFGSSDAKGFGDSPFRVDPGDDSGSKAAAAAAGASLETNVIMQALAQLLVEKGVIGRKEFAERIRKLAAKNTEPA